MKLRAKVRRATGATTHSLGGIVEGRPELRPLKTPSVVELVERDGACYLLHLDDRGKCVADTWHPNVDEAKAQAAFEFDIGPSDWSVHEA